MRSLPTVYDTRRTHRARRRPVDALIQRLSVNGSGVAAGLVRYQEKRQVRAAPVTNWFRDPPGPVTIGELATVSAR